MLNRSTLGSTRLLSTGVLIGVAAVVLVSGILTADSLELYGWDFRVQYYRGARAVAEGAQLYPRPEALAFDAVPPYVYPPMTAVVLVPLTILSEDAAVVVATIASLAAVLGALALVGVRDVRCYAAVLASAPAWNILETANLNAALALALALAWRLRSTVWPLALALGLAVAAKIFVWPLLVWSAATGRDRPAALAVAVGSGATMAAWSVIGFDGLSGYPALLRRLAEVWSAESYSIDGMAAALGLEPAIGRVLALIVGVAFLTGCLRFGRNGDDLRAFTCAIAGALALTPIVWVQYAVFLLVPLGLARPRFSAVWLLPMALWVVPRTGNGEGLQPFVPAVIAALLLLAMLARPRVTSSPAEVPA